jgi:hypothetical protein
MVLGDDTKYARIADGSTIKMTGPGMILLKASMGKRPITLTGVWLSPEASCRLVSTNQLALQGFKTVIGKTTDIFDKQGHHLIRATSSSPGDILYWFQSESITPTGRINTLLDVSSSDFWHHCLGHCSDNALQHLAFSTTGLPKLPLKSQISLPPCYGCQLGKSHERPLGPSDKRSTHVLGLVHTDLIELPTESRTRARWILTFINDCSAFAFLAFLHHKSDTTLWFCVLVLHAETLTGLSVTSVRSDHGGEYHGQDLLQFFTSKGISRQYSVPHLPQQNGRAERFN